MARRNEMKENNYVKLSLMMLVSFIIMYLVMFLNIVDISHFYISLTRIYMALLMVLPMVIVMITFMPGMYQNQKLNKVLISTSAILFFVVVFFLRQQIFVTDSQYMKAMIPHHSSAILTSKQATIRDIEVRKLANDIIEAQEREIRLMKEYLQRINQ
jgi:hypothetical protein